MADQVFFLRVSFLTTTLKQVLFSDFVVYFYVVIELPLLSGPFPHAEALRDIWTLLRFRMDAFMLASNLSATAI